ncbi:MAG: MaoC family dehydratase N-terminal domain-containing protein [Chloroflexi bacterium]|nr:MaoC family dehydratase N-terminal domain-containing protein [Chloroflexota bacterium]
MVEQQVEFDRSLLNREFPAGTFEVTEETILRLCRAVGEANPLFTDRAEAQRQGHPGLVAPPTLCNLFIRGLNRPDLKLNFGKFRMHAGQALEPLRPIYAGDTLEARTRLKEVYAKTGRTGTMAFVVWETSFTSQRGEVVTLVRESFMVR